MDIYFPGGQRVDALHEGFWIRTDQPVEYGGEGSGPSPLDLFVASIGTCAGFYALRFCQQRNLDERGLALSATPERSVDGKRVHRIRIELTLPPTFPEKYREAISRAIDQCAVKRHLLEPPLIEITVVPASVESGPLRSAVSIPEAMSSLSSR
jgi:putative redox protein